MWQDSSEETEDCLFEMWLPFLKFFTFDQLGQKDHRHPCLLPPGPASLLTGCACC